jgi:glutathione S-transferase
MLKLLQFTQTGKPDPSLFCGKVELYLKINELDHEIGIESPLKAPKKKLPMIIDGGNTVCDSEHILDYLDSKHGIDMDQALSDEQKARSWALIRAIEEHLYFALVYSRWIDDRCWPVVREKFLENIGFPLSLVLPNLVRSSVRKSLTGQGLGRHTQEEIYAFAALGVRHLAQLLGDQDYFFGNSISRADLSAFPFLYNQIHFEIETETGAAVREHKNLIDYVERIVALYYS